VSVRPIAVIGGTGFIGRHLVERLRAAHAPVVVVSRHAAWPDGPPPADVTMIRVDLSDPASVPVLRAGLAGSDRVIALAGLLMRPGRDKHAYRRLHVDGVRHLLTALAPTAAPDRPVRLVHVSTTGVLGPTGGTPLDENAPPDPRTPYEITKLEGERLALAARAPGLEVVVVRPGWVYGPGDAHLLALCRAVRRGLFVPIAGGRARWQPIFVDDLVRALEAALTTPGLDGAVLHAAGAEVVTIADLGARLARRLGARPRTISMPKPPALLAGALLELLCRPFGIEPPLSRQRVRTLTEDRLYAIDRIRERLGFTPEVTLDGGLDRAIAWYRGRGLL
jgi:nucleoside-diphosphate-sugar epimerase